MCVCGVWCVRGVCVCVWGVVCEGCVCVCVGGGGVCEVCVNNISLKLQQNEKTVD